MPSPMVGTHLVTCESSSLFSSFQLLFHVTELSIGTTLRLRLPHHSSALPTTPPHPRETPRPWEELSKRITERG